MVGPLNTEVQRPALSELVGLGAGLGVVEGAEEGGARGETSACAVEAGTSVGGRARGVGAEAADGGSGRQALDDVGVGGSCGGAGRAPPNRRGGGSSHQAQQHGAGLHGSNFVEMR